MANTAKSVGMIGLGIMGSAMASNLVKAGFRVLGYDVREAAREALIAAGGEATHSSLDILSEASIVITSLPTVTAIEEVCTALTTIVHRDVVIIETSTLPLDVKEHARHRMEAAGITLLDCPLSGTGAQARTKDLAVYASGPRDAVERCSAVFQGFARSHEYVGEFGAGSKMKYIANHLVAIHNIAAAEALVLAKKAGLDIAEVVRVIGDGAGTSRMLQVRGPMMASEDYSDATMKVEVWQKDMHIIAEFATQLECPTPLFSLCAPIYTAAMAAGYAKDDTAAVHAVLSTMAGVKN